MEEDCINSAQPRALNITSSTKDVKTLQDEIKLLVNQRNDLREQLRAGRPTMQWGAGRGEVSANFVPIERGTGKNFRRGFMPPGSMIGRDSVSGRSSFDNCRLPVGERGLTFKRRRESNDTDPSSTGGWQVKVFGGPQPLDEEMPSVAQEPSNELKVQQGLSPEELRVEKRPKINQDGTTIKRHKNLFGSLMGHLKKAKATLEKEQETKQCELQKSQTMRVDMKLQQERQNYADRRRKEIVEQKQKQVQKMREVQRDIIAKDIELLKVKLENHYRRMTNFIRTRCDPPIFWLPAIHNERTLQLQMETRQQIEHKVESLRQQFSTEYINESVISAIQSYTNGTSEQSLHQEEEAQNSAAASPVLRLEVDISSPVEAPQHEEPVSPEGGEVDEMVGMQHFTSQEFSEEGTSFFEDPETPQLSRATSRKRDVILVDSSPTSSLGEYKSSADVEQNYNDEKGDPDRRSGEAQTRDNEIINSEISEGEISEGEIPPDEEEKEQQRLFNLNGDGADVQIVTAYGIAGVVKIDEETAMESKLSESPVDVDRDSEDEEDNRIQNGDNGAALEDKEKDVVEASPMADVGELKKSVIGEETAVEESKNEDTCMLLTVEVVDDETENQVAAVIVDDEEETKVTLKDTGADECDSDKNMTIKVPEKVKPPSTTTKERKDPPKKRKSEILREEDVNAMTVKDLSSHLKKRGLSTTGLKLALRDRLLSALRGESSSSIKK